MMKLIKRWAPVIIVIPLFLPFLHPLLIPLVGVPSHLLWFTHVATTAAVTYRYGHKGALLIVPLSLSIVVACERLFGAGYWIPADWFTVLALGISSLFVNLLMVGFGLYARRITQRYQILFQELTIGVLRLDRRFIILAANPEACRILDLNEQDLTGTPVNEVLSDNVPDIQHLDEMQSWEGSIQVGPSGEQQERYVLMTALILSQPYGIQLLVVDRTMEVVQEREIGRQSKLASLGEALAGVAHEFKNPLQIISGYAELAAHTEQSSEKMRENFVKIKEQGDRMRDMVQDLLGYSRQDIETSEKVDVVELIRELMSMERIALGKRYNVVEDMQWEGTIEVSRNRIEQILLNFISNAYDSIAEKGGSTITIGTRVEGDWLEISVKDDGPGIPEDVIEKVFDPFVTTKEKGEGTGLGLAISQRFARSMDGELIAANLPAGGAAFTLRLPLKR